MHNELANPGGPASLPLAPALTDAMPACLPMRALVDGDLVEASGFVEFLCYDLFSFAKDAGWVIRELSEIRGSSMR